MRRLHLLATGLLLVLVSCSGTVGEPTTTRAVDVPVTTTAPDTTSVDSDTTTTTATPPGPTTTTSGRSLAPDFTLELGDGGQYTLSEGAKPVYLVFWAEW